MRKTGRHTSRLSSWGLYFSQNSDTIGTLYDFHKGGCAHETGILER